jgi:uncharacterized membrane protein
MNTFFSTLGLDRFAWGAPELIQLHAAAAHFPIALFLTSVACEALGLVFKKQSLREGAFWMHLFATLGAGVTVALGWFGNPWRFKHNEMAQTVQVHQWWGIASLSCMVLLLAWRLARRNRLGRFEFVAYGLATLLVMSLVAVTGYMGGHMSE